jgi:diaminopimelate decarboxylase
MTLPTICAEIDGVAIAELVAKFGSPLFVYSERTLRQTYRTMREAFCSRYPRVKFAWSYKTNYLPAICAILHQEGAEAEIVSKLEYEKAHRLGVPGERTIFNGPYKPFETLLAAVAAGVFVNADHVEELADLQRIAQHLQRRIKIGIRLNLHAGIEPAWSRFGFNLESGEALAVVRRLADMPELQLTGLHCHIGTSVLDASAYAREVTKLVQFSHQLRDELGIVIDTLDIGGGFSSPSRERAATVAEHREIPSIDSYAEHVCQALHASLRTGEQPTLVIEAGRSMIDTAGYLITTIQAAKRLPNGMPAYVADAGVNLLLAAFWYRFQIACTREIAGEPRLSMVHGPLCMNIDTLHEAVSLPPLERGEPLVFWPVGAYNNTQWMQFIEYRPHVVLITESGEVELIRHAEDASDLARREILPSRMQPYFPE